MITWQTEVVSLNYQPTNPRIPVEMIYDPEYNPFAITLVFYSSGEDLPGVDWIVSRELLVSGMYSTEWVGAGDVKIKKGASSEVLYASLSGDSGRSILGLVRDDLFNFISETTYEVPAGEESVDIDALIKGLLS